MEFKPSVKAALFVLNSDTVQAWLNPSEGNLVDRLSKTSSSEDLSDELYLSVLSRLPSDEERASVAAYLEKRSGDRPLAIKNLTWALLASTEFCVNH